MTSRRFLRLESLEDRNLLAGLNDLPDVETETTPAGSAMVQFDLQVTNKHGNTVTTAEPGEELLLNVRVNDNRLFDAKGAFAAYVDIVMSELVEPIGDVVFSSDYPHGRSGQATPTGVDEMGGFTGAAASPTETLLAQIPFMALGEGEATITSNPADDIPAHELLLAGTPTTVPLDSVEFGSVTLHIEEMQWHNTDEPYDVNDDGHVSPIDALLVINYVNAHLSSSLPEDNPGSGMIDVNNDGSVTARDVLLVINELNPPTINEPVVVNYSQLARSIVGMDLEAAEQVIVQNGGVLEVTSLDGAPSSPHTEYLTNRVSVTVVAGVVTQALSEWEYETLYPNWFDTDNVLA